MDSGELVFHGQAYNPGSWNSSKYTCCRLCKTRNCSAKYRHWAKGLCRSCYRRLSVPHRLYNDKWNKEHSKPGSTRRSRGKKQYKYLDLDNFSFSEDDITTVLERYNWRCAYSGTPLQGYDYKAPNSFQLEYQIFNGKISLVPVCRTINCSKKGLKSEEDLKKWAEANGVFYPFSYITVEDYYDSI